MVTRVTLSFNGVSHTVKVIELHEYDRIGNTHSYVLEGLTPTECPDEIQDVISFYPGAQGSIRNTSNDRQSVAHIPPECPVSVTKWQDVSDSSPGPKKTHSPDNGATH